MGPVLPTLGRQRQKEPTFKIKLSLGTRSPDSK